MSSNESIPARLQNAKQKVDLASKKAPACLAPAVLNAGMTPSAQSPPPQPQPDSTTQSDMETAKTVQRPIMDAAKTAATGSAHAASATVATEAQEGPSKWESLVKPSVESAAKKSKKEASSASPSSGSRSKVLLIIGVGLAVVALAIGGMFIKKRLAGKTADHKQKPSKKADSDVATGGGGSRTAGSPPREIVEKEFPPGYVPTVQQPHSQFNTQPYHPQPQIQPQPQPPQLQPQPQQPRPYPQSHMQPQAEEGGQLSHNPAVRSELQARVMPYPPPHHSLVAHQPPAKTSPKPPTTRHLIPVAN